MIISSKKCVICSKCFEKKSNECRAAWVKHITCSLQCRYVYTSLTMKGQMPKNIDQIKGWNKGMRGSTPVGDNHGMWKGDNVGVVALHDWIKRYYGFPNTCEHCGLVSDNHHVIHWANKSGDYKRERSDWLRLCASCHKKYDVRDKKTHCRLRHDLALTGKIDARGWRYCYICRLLTNRKYKAKVKET